MANIQLRDYQRIFIEDVCNSFRNGNKRVCGVAPCGSGKTVIAAFITRQALSDNMRVIFFVHRHELIEQTSATFKALGIEHGLIAADEAENLELPVQIASVQTLIRRIERIPAPNLLICDECHHILADSYKKIIDTFSNALLLGVTATPIRLGNIGLGDVFEDMVQAPDVKHLIELGNLTPFAFFAPEKPVDLTGLRACFGEFNLDELEAAMTADSVLRLIVDTYLKFAAGKAAICYCVNRAHSNLLADKFRNSGINAVHCDGTTPKDLRKAIINDFRNGSVKILCNAELFGEGFDVPNMDAVVLARPTKSLALHIQQSMRPMRPDPSNPDKVALILDCVGNLQRHNFPDARHKWALNYDDTFKSEEVLSKICPNCGAIVPLGAFNCPECGYEFDMRKNISDSWKKIRFYDLEELPPRFAIDFFLEVAADKKYKNYWAVIQALKVADSLETCRYIAQRLGYKQGWAWYKWMEICERKK